MAPHRHSLQSYLWLPQHGTDLLAAPSLQPRSQAARQAQYVSEVEALRAHLDACARELQAERRTAMQLQAECEAARCAPGRAANVCMCLHECVHVSAHALQSCGCCPSSAASHHHIEDLSTITSTPAPWFLAVALPSCVSVLLCQAQQPCNSRDVQSWVVQVLT